MKDSPSASNRSGAIAREAADWLIALESADWRTRESFAAWLRESPEHIREYLAVAAIWDALPELAPEPSSEGLARLASGPENVVMMPGAATAAGGADEAAGRRRWIGWAAAAILVTAGVAAIVLTRPAPEEGGLYATVTGEQSSVALPDGSLATLNTRSRMRVAYSREYRDVHLADGEALFEVAQNPARPFRVITEQAVIQAVGTRFNVRKDAGEVTVTVVEGVVEVASTTRRVTASTPAENRPEGIRSAPAVRLTVGQQARVRTASREAVVADAAVEKAIAWRERRLVFESLPLKQVIEEFNRYNAPPVAIRDPELEALPISGVFRSDDRSSFLQFLSRMELAEPSVGPDGVIVLKSVRSEELKP